jgi:hypothetical protein
MIVTLAVLCGGLRAEAAISDPVKAGRGALEQQTDFPWYDDQADDVQPVAGRGEVKEIKGGSGEGKQAREQRDSGTTFSPGAKWEGAEVIAWILVGAVVVLLVGVLIYAILQSDPGAAKDRKSDSAAAGDLAALPVPVAGAGGDLLAEARRRYERGEFAQAMVYLYSHVLVRLDRGHLIRLAKGKTNRQYLREVGSRRSLAEYFELAMHTFEAAFFGRRELARDEFEAAWRGVDDFHRLVEEAHA